MPELPEEMPFLDWHPGDITHDAVALAFPWLNKRGVIFIRSILLYRAITTRHAFEVEIPGVSTAIYREIILPATAREVLSRGDIKKYGAVLGGSVKGNKNKAAIEQSIKYLRHKMEGEISGPN